MQIFVQMVDGKRYAIEVHGSDRVRDLKRKVEEKTQWKPDEQKLIYYSVTLTDDKTLEEYQIVKESTVNVVKILRSVKVRVAFTNGRTAEIVLSESDKIVDLKRKIQETFGIAPGEQRLVYDGLQLQEDDKTIVECQIENESKITVVTKSRKITARLMDGRKVIIQFSETDRISDVKRKIHEAMGIPIDELTLSFQGGVLEDDKTVAECGIAENSTIDILSKLRGGKDVLS